MAERARAWRVLFDLKMRKCRRLDDEAATARAALADADTALASAEAEAADCDAALDGHAQRLARTFTSGSAITAAAYADDARYRDMLKERCDAAHRNAGRARETRDASQRALDDTLARLARVQAQADWYAQRDARDRREVQAAQEEAEEEEVMEGVIEAARRRRMAGVTR
ncbi:hypothetical protein WS90_25230 [Burkholderia cepacia]|uniref:Type III secretion protein HrpB7 n=1 Tax=Burkholderia cepacia TaxID=292 RepID=A0A103Z9I7_BURCE|nr:hypothetical protein [Burkholderia cepacia]KVK75950.1 hypothetical protein WS90_25230 [Burkholderia cepacia]